jgi:hypothetical protein
MNETLHRRWPAALTALTALLYVWIGLAAHGGDRILGTAGGLLILAALAAAPRSRPAALVLLAASALPLAAATWWSIVTPVLAVLALLLGWVAVRNLSRPARMPAVLQSAAPGRVRRGGSRPPVGPGARHQPEMGNAGAHPSWPHER